jgi:hypothetical protein
VLSLGSLKPVKCTRISRLALFPAARVILLYDETELDIGMAWVVVAVECVCDNVMVCVMVDGVCVC